MFGYCCNFCVGKYLPRRPSRPFRLLAVALWPSREVVSLVRLDIIPRQCTVHTNPIIKDAVYPAITISATSPNPRPTCPSLPQDNNNLSKPKELHIIRAPNRHRMSHALRINTLHTRSVHRPCISALRIIRGCSLGFVVVVAEDTGLFCNVSIRFGLQSLHTEVARGGIER
jgi:hypothetical protein